MHSMIRSPKNNPISFSLPLLINVFNQLSSLQLRQQYIAYDDMVMAIQNASTTITSMVLTPIELNLYLTLIMDSANMTLLQPKCFQMSEEIVGNISAFLSGIMNSIIVNNTNPELTSSYETLRFDILSYLQTTASRSFVAPMTSTARPMSYSTSPTYPMNTNLPASNNAFAYSQSQPRYPMPPTNNASSFGGPSLPPNNPMFTKAYTPMNNNMPRNMNNNHNYNHNTNNNNYPMNNNYSNNNSNYKANNYQNNNNNYQMNNNGFPNKPYMNNNNNNNNNYNNTNNNYQNNNINNMRNLPPTLYGNMNTNSNNYNNTMNGGMKSMNYNDPMIRFFSYLRKQGADVITPQASHDKFLAAIYASVKIKDFSALRDLIEMTMMIKESKIITQVDHVSKTKIRGILALLKQSGCLMTETSEDGKDVRFVWAADILSFKDLRERHDEFLLQSLLQHRITLSLDRKAELVWMFSEEIKLNRIELLEKIMEKVTDYINSLDPTMIPSSAKAFKKTTNDDLDLGDDALPSDSMIDYGSKPHYNNNINTNNQGNNNPLKHQYQGNSYAMHPYNNNYYEEEGGEDHHHNAFNNDLQEEYEEIEPRFLTNASSYSNNNKNNNSNLNNNFDFLPSGNTSLPSMEGNNSFVSPFNSQYDFLDLPSESLSTSTPSPLGLDRPIVIDNLPQHKPPMLVDHVKTNPYSSSELIEEHELPDINNLILS